MTTESLGKKSVHALVSWGFDKAVENWPAILVFLATGGGMTYLASVSAWLQPYGPVVWGAIGLAGMFALAVCGLLAGIMRERFANANYTALRASAKSANVLEPIHKHERINLVDFFTHLYRPTTDARFEKCQLLGPMNVVLRGCTLSHCGFINCEVVLVRAGIPVVGAALFQGCQFLDTELFGVTFLMTHAEWLKWPEEARKSIPVISDGTVGNI